MDRIWTRTALQLISPAGTEDLAKAQMIRVPAFRNSPWPCLFSSTFRKSGRTRPLVNYCYAALWLQAGDVALVIETLMHDNPPESVGVDLSVKMALRGRF
jgi:hypothetical protein